MNEFIVTKIKKIGPGSLGIIIPAEYANIRELNEGNIVNVSIEKEKEVD